MTYNAMGSHEKFNTNKKLKENKIPHTNVK